MRSKAGKNSSDLADWKKISGQQFRNIFASAKKIVNVSYQFPAKNESMRGKRLLFFSDLHYDYRQIKGNDLIKKINGAAPDWILFGGDLISYSAFLRPALDIIRELNSKRLKLAVLGNWDKRRRRWLPHIEWNKYHASAGFRLLVNDSAVDDGIYFYGTDDCKAGIPDIEVPKDENIFSVIISHNPDTVVDFFKPEDLRRVDLILCGHTHGGQVRMPFFGALKTSSRYWKKFEYGRFLNEKTGTQMIVSSGIGTTYKPWRFCCPPEIVIIDFI